MRNGYLYGKNVKATFERTEGSYYEIGLVTKKKKKNGIVENVFSLVNIDLGAEHDESYYLGSIVYNNNDNATVQNNYSVGIGNNITNFNNGPNVGYCRSEKVSNSYYFSDEIINHRQIVVNRIKNALGLQTYKIYARNCEIREIDSKLKSKFLTIEEYKKPERNYG